MPDPDVEQLVNEAIEGDHPKPAPEDSSAKLGQLLNDNATLRQQHDALRLELEALKARAAQPATHDVDPAADPNDASWKHWAHEALKEATDDDLLTNPRAALEAVLARTGKELTQHVTGLSVQKMWEVVGTQKLDTEFERIRPDLYETQMGKIAVQQAVAEIGPDPRFQALIKSPSGRVRAYDLIGKIADRKLGRSDTTTPDPDGLLDIPQRKSTYAAPSSVRVGGPGAPRITNGKDEALGEAIKYLRGNRTEMS